MGMIRKGLIGIKDNNNIDTPQKLLDFAKRNNINVCPLDVKSVAHKMGIKVNESTTLPDAVSGILEKDEGGHWTIYTNVRQHPNRQRFAIAHELGHYCLHRFQETFFEDRIFFRGLESIKTEYQANMFAYKILIPEYQLLKLLNNGIRDIEELAKKFGVSTLALRIHAKNLGYSGHGL
jgi:Zn-dependent peptidase ImmA (M78 family)